MAHPIDYARAPLAARPAERGLQAQLGTALASP
jgi:hypothetical protein